MRTLNFDNKKPLLYLVATPIGNLDEFSPRAIQIIKEADLIACEDTRVTMKLLKFFNISKPVISIREHNEVMGAENIIPKILAGVKVVYMSDAGYPCISDPGSRLVKLALANDINVSTISGPNAALNALVASGLDSDHFYFHGFLNAKESVRQEELRKLTKGEETLIFYESPHRISKTLNDLYLILGARKACIARELTKKHEEFIRSNLKEMLSIDPETLKGEMVILVEGSKGEVQPDISNEELIEMVNKMVSSGLSTKDAIKNVSEITNISKNTIYKIYHIN